MIEQITLKGKPSYIYLSTEDFYSLREYLAKQYINKGYGWLLAINPDRYYQCINKNKCGIYQLNNVIPTYINGNIRLEYIGDYNFYLKIIKLYDDKLETILHDILLKVKHEIING